MSQVDVATRAGVSHPVSAPLAAGAALLGGCVAVALVDPSGGPTVCPFRLVTGLDCPGCGATRAAHQLFTGHLLAAADLNLLALVAIPLVLWGLYASLTAMLGGPRWRTFSPSEGWLRVALVVAVAFWVVRNIPLAPFAWLSSSG
jgi:hypothetical protein